MDAAPATAALCFSLALLLGERGLAHSRRWREAAGDAHGLVRLELGALLIGAAASACTAIALGDAPSALPAIAGLATGAAALVWRCRSLRLDRPQALWAIGVFALLHAAAALPPRGSTGALLAAFATALCFSIGLPAFLALARRMEDCDVPGFMRPLPARALAAGILALALGSLASW